MQDSTAETRLLLGLAGWPHPEWQGGYFPDDLPADWQFAYYSNDADCLLLGAQQWRTLDAEILEDWLEDAPEHFRFYLQVAADGVDEAALRPFGGHVGGLLVEDFLHLDSGLPQFRQSEGGYWLDARGRARLFRWRSLPADLRAQREVLQQLPATLDALVIGDEAADPRSLADTRTLAELLGIA